MPNNNKYYYIISSLPELEFEGKLPFTLKDFFEEFGNELNSSKNLIDILILKNDIENLKLVFKNEDDKENLSEPSVYNIEELKEGIKANDKLPEFILEFLASYETNEEYIDNSKKLEKNYYLYGLKTNNYFIKEYFQFELNFRNAIAALRGRYKDEDVLKYSAGDTDDVVLVKIKNNKSLPDFNISGEAPWMEKLLQAFDKKNDPLALEKTLDDIRFRVIDDIITLNHFDINRVLGFIAKLMILERWFLFNKETGKKYIENITKDIQSIVKMQ